MMYDVVLISLSCLILTTNSSQIQRKLFPIKYDLTLTPYFESESDSHFEGRLVFTFKPFRHHTARTIALHAEGLSITSFVLLQNFQNQVKQLEATFEYDLDNQLINVDTGYELTVDSAYELHLNYSGKITSDGWGLYKGLYEVDGKNRFYVATQLRPVFARRLLPCLDEPLYKAHFKLRVWRPPHHTVRSNMPRIDSSPRSLETGRVLDTFAETPRMSAFLLALVVFDFTALSSDDGRYSSWTVPGKTQLAAHGHRMVPDIVQAMESVTGSKFPLPKLDQIALPQLNPVAMENWGMNTYREVFMLYQEGEFPPRVRQDVPRFTGHEVCHHWLGNLVTLQWWDWLWLSEMFAMYYEYFLPSQVEPSWRMSDQMVVDLVMPGLLGDSSASSRPLTTSVSTNQEILAKFSGLTYTKGPALLRMVIHFMTPHKAEQALRAVLHEKKYDIVNPKELWTIYDRYAEDLPATMETIMNSWTDRAGYPVVTVQVNHSDGRVTARQERFLIEGGDGRGGPLWWVPLTYSSGLRPNYTSTEPKVWLTPAEDFISFRVAQHLHSWLLFNTQLVGFYRVNYNQENWDKLVDTLLSEPSVIHEVNRAQLLDDSFNLARAGRVAYATPLHMATYLTAERCYFPWAAVAPTVDFLQTTLNGHPSFNSFRDFMRQLVAPVYSSLDFSVKTSDSHLDQLNRVQVVTLACSLGLPACVQAALQQEDLITMGRATTVAPGLEAAQLCTVLEAGVSPYTRLSSLPQEAQIAAMPCVADKAILERYINNSAHDDSESLWRSKLTAATKKLVNAGLVFSFLINNRERLFSRFGTKNFADYLSLVGPTLTTKEHLEEMDLLRRIVNDEEVSRAVDTTSARLSDKLTWIERHSSSIWLLTNSRNLTHRAHLPPVYC